MTKNIDLCLEFKSRVHTGLDGKIPVKAKFIINVFFIYLVAGSKLRISKVSPDISFVFSLY